VRHERQFLALTPETYDFNFYFQVAHLGARHACRVRIRATSKTQATNFFQDNLSVIEALARKNLTSSPAKSKLIELRANC